ncbi:MAG: substrate-binding domain-containing protein [Actinobacteria bacterium]|nr:substrate-binding domain-containing protein [Actinomycetota bacterium]
MRFAPRRSPRLLALPLALTLLAAACGGSEDESDPTAAPGSGSGGGGELSGDIVISGSSTVEPISIDVAGKFGEIAPDVNVAVSGPGTGDGFQAFCNGETDISDASRAIKPEEIQACEANGIEFIEMKVAIDGIAVLTSPDGEGIAECLSFADMYALVGPESQGFEQWSDANELAAGLEGTVAAPFPDVPLVITAPGEESGTYDSFVEIVLEGIAEDRGQEPQTRPDYQASADDNVIVRGIQGAPSSFGWVGYAFFEANQGTVKAFQVAGDDGTCVAPTAETIADGSYPIARPLFIYANAANLEEKPALAEFVELYLSEEGITSAAEVGYVALPEEEIEATRAAFEARETGTREG